MPRDSDKFIWLPLSNTLSFGQMLLANDWVDLDNCDVPSEVDLDHVEAQAGFRDILNVRVGIWGNPVDDSADAAARYMREVTAEVCRYSPSYFLANLAYYIGSAVQFLLTVQLNPIHTVDQILRVGSVEKQAKLMLGVLRALEDRYVKEYPKRSEQSSLLKYLRNMSPVLERMSMADTFNPINKECIPLERLKDLSGGKVSITGNEKGWTIKKADGKKVAQNVDGGQAIMEAVSALQFGEEA